MVNAPSAYNVILGRSTINDFHAVISVYYQKMQFPVGDQRSTRKCYVEMVQEESSVEFHIEF